MAKHAAAGIFQNTGNEDMIQFKTSQGTVIMLKFSDGSVQTSAASTTGTDIDGGTF
jgi:hypothetical protein